MSEQKDKCPECEEGYRTANDGTVSTCPTCYGTGEKKLDSPKGKIADIRFGKDDIQYFPDGIAYLSEKGMAKILALIEPLIEEAEKKIRKEMYEQLQEVEDGLVERTKTQEGERIIEYLTQVADMTDFRLAMHTLKGEK